MINSKNIDELKEPVRGLALAWLIKCRADGLDVVIISTYRDNEYQDFLFAQGRTRKGNIITNARGGESEHNKRNAFDFAVKVRGVITWHDTHLYEQAGHYAELLGLVWGGKFKIRDLGHIQGK